MSELYQVLGLHDPFSCLSHFCGAVLFLVLSFPLLKLGWGNFSKFLALTIFAVATVFTLSMSGVYHLLPSNGARDVLQRLDHSAIFILIVGTMTPIHQILFKGFMRWGWLICIWTIAITAVVLKNIFFAAFPEWLGLVLYLGLGWLGAVSAGILWYQRSLSFIKPIFFGGLAYTIGAVLEFIHQPILIVGVFEPHEFFHIAVLVGLGFHWKFVYTIAKL